MNRRRSVSQAEGLSGADTQLSLLAVDPAISLSRNGARAAPRRGGRRRIPDAESMLWMRDVTQLIGVHRSTILRWMHQGTFPKKDAPKRRPTGWLRSTFDRWLVGSYTASAGVEK